MIDLVAPLAGLVGAAAGCEWLLRGTKVQAVVGKVLAVFAVFGAAAAFAIALFGDVEAASFLVFWSGAFLFWFGVRSHIESSVLLGLIYELRAGPLSRSELLHAYRQRHGEGRRFDDLLRAGLLVSGPEGPSVTSKGRLVSRIAAHFR